MIKGRGRRGSSCPTPSLADPHILHLGLSLFQGESYVQLGAAYKRRPAPMMPSTLCGSSALVSGLQILLEGDYLLLLLLLLYPTSFQTLLLEALLVDFTCFVSFFTISKSLTLQNALLSEILQWVKISFLCQTNKSCPEQRGQFLSLLFDILPTSKLLVVRRQVKE